MRAAIFRNGGIVVDDLGDPTPSEGQVLVKSLCCGICGSDHTRLSIPWSSSIAPAGRAIVGPWIRNVTSCSGMSFAAKWWIMARGRTNDSSLALWSAPCR